MKSIRKDLIKKTLPLFIAATMSTSCAYFTGNFHTVKEDYVYRSAQLNDGPLEEKIKEYGIKTIINLRGAYPDEGWWQDEMAISRKYGIAHYDIRFSSSSIPRKDKLIELFEIFDNAEYPLLFHCLAGADRASLVAGIYKLQYEKTSLKEALKQLSFFRYGHINARSMDNFFKLYKKFGKGKDLRTWVEEDYDEVKYEGYFKSLDDLKFKRPKEEGMKYELDKEDQREQIL